MHSRALSPLLFLLGLLLATLACALRPESVPQVLQVTPTTFSIVSLSVSPGSGNGKFTGTLTYVYGDWELIVLHCYYPSPDGRTTEDRLTQVLNDEVEKVGTTGTYSWDFEVTAPRQDYSVDCTFEQGVTRNAKFTVTDAPAADNGAAPAATRAGHYVLDSQFLASKSVAYWKGWLGKSAPAVSGNNMEITLSPTGTVTGGVFYLELQGSATGGEEGVFFNALCANVGLVIRSKEITGGLAADSNSGEIQFTSNTSYTAADLHPEDKQACQNPTPTVDQIRIVFYFDEAGVMAACEASQDDTSRIGCLVAPLAWLKKVP